jgi:hypothetical protein
MGWNPEREAAVGHAPAGLPEDGAAYEGGHARFDYEFLAAAPVNGNGAAGHSAKRDDPAATGAGPGARPKKRPPLDERGAKRLERAEEIAKKDDCRAASVQEFETTYRAKLVADGLREGDRLSDVVVEHARNRFIDNAGGDDPIRRMLAGRMFDLDLQTAKFHATLAKQGPSGYKIAGAVANKMDRNVLDIATTLLRFPPKAQRPAAPAPDPEPEAEDRRRLAEYRELQQARGDEVVRQLWRDEKAAWDALKAEDREALIRYQLGRLKAKPDEWPDHPEIESDDAFDFIPYLAPERFTDDDRIRSGWEPPPGWKQEVGPPSTAAPFEPADVGPPIVEADAPASAPLAGGASPAAPASDDEDDEDDLDDSTYEREEVRFAALSLADKAAIIRYCVALNQRRLRGAVGAAGPEPALPEVLKRERFLYFEQLVADAARSAEPFDATNAKRSRAHTEAGAVSPAGP